MYVDNDPSTVTHSRQLLAGARNVVYIEGDLRDPTGILGRAEVRDLLDFDQPIGLIAVAVVHFVSPHFKPHRLISRYMSALASGSYLALSHATADRMADHVIETILSVYDNASEKLYFRTREEIAQFRRDGDGAPICGGTAEVDLLGLVGCGGSGAR